MPYTYPGNSPGRAIPDKKSHCKRAAHGAHDILHNSVKYTVSVDFTKTGAPVEVAVICDAPAQVAVNAVTLPLTTSESTTLSDVPGAVTSDMFNRAMYPFRIGASDVNETIGGITVSKIGGHTALNENATSCPV